MQLNAVEARVLGSLIEKAATTPEHYPLSSQALVAACNQKQNREPVTTLGEDEVLDAVKSLREEGLVRSVKRPGDRVMKHRHDADGRLRLDDQELAVLAVLLLRGDQTPGELRARTDRYTDFAELSDIDATLERLADREEPLVVQRAREPGQKESRWRCLLSETPPPATSTTTTPSALARENEVNDALEDRVETLEREVATLRTELAALLESLGS